MFKKALILIWAGLFLLGNSNLVLAQPQIKKEVIKKPEPKISEEAIKKPGEEIKTKVEKRVGIISDAPRIREFSITPNFGLVGQSVTAVIRWRVESIPGGSPVSSISIIGPEINLSGRDLTGQYNVNIPSQRSPTRLLYRLTAFNTADRQATKDIYFEVEYIGSLTELRDEISVERVYAQPAEFSEGSSFTVIFRLNNRSDIRLSGVLIQIRYTNFIPWVMTATPPLDETPAHIELRDQIINPGINEYRFRDTLSAIDGPWLVGHLRGYYQISVKYQEFGLVFPADLTLYILVNQTEPRRTYRIERHTF